MKLTFLGSGTAFSPASENYNSNMVLESDTGKNLLIDCGVDIRHSAHALNYHSQDFDGVYISHFHADHCGGMEWLALSRKFTKNATRPKLMIHPSMTQELWDHVLQGGLSTIKEYESTIETYFELYPFLDATHFQWEGIDFELVQAYHVYHMQQLRPTYGLFIRHNNTKLFITADTQFVPDRYRDYYQAADYIFHDCETGPNRSGVHAHYDDLLTLPKKIKQKTWLYHYSALHAPKDHDGFAGFVQRGQVFDFQ